MATQHLVLTNWHPTPLNRLLRNRWKSASLKKLDRTNIKLESVSQGITKADGRRRVELHIWLAPKQRGCDPDAYWKSLLDALVSAELLTDDNTFGCELMPVQFHRGPQRATEIVLTDIAPCQLSALPQPKPNRQGRSSPKRKRCIKRLYRCSASVP